MKLAVTNEQMRDAENLAGRNGISGLQLMKNAGQACFDRICKLLGGSVKEKSIVVLAGRGNNGGDGIVIADLLLDAEANAILVFAVDLPSSECARQCYSIYETGLNTCIYPHRAEEVKNILLSCDAVIDCVYGTGFHGELDESLAELFKFVNENCRALKISVDIPSGCNGNTGDIAANAFRPDFTITLAAVKKGLYSHPCFEHCGMLLLADIGIPQNCYESCEAVLTSGVIKEFFPKRRTVSHKGSYGKLLNISGSAYYTGAAMLSTGAALRTGVGLCVLATPARVINAIAAQVPEAVYFPLDQDMDGFINERSVDKLKEHFLMTRYSAVLIGCGLGNSKFTCELTEYVTKTADCPVIIDADGLNSISENIHIIKDSKRSVIVTPHPAEFSRMTGKSVEEIQKDRITSAKAFAAQYGVITVLKGVNTVIASPTGETFINTTGNPALAKGGSGDVLSGIIASLAAQGTDPFYAAVLGVYLHGLAADTLAKEKALFGILPRDLIEILPHLK